MKRVYAALVVGAGLLLCFGESLQNQNVIFKTSILISPAIKRSEPVWSWAPRLKFNVQGPLPSGSQISVGFFQPGGRAWLTQDCKTPTVEAGKIGQVECGYTVPTDRLQAITSTGTFGFKIMMRNELAGTNDTLFQGRFEVRKFHSGPDLPSTKGNFEYYVDHDWQLPIGFVWCPQPYRSADGVSYYDDYSPLLAALWFKGALVDSDLDAHLFYQGSEISSTRAHGHAVSEFGVSTGQATSPYEYKRVKFEFTQVFGFAKDSNAHPGYYLNKHPGEYEVKVLRGGHLARSFRFTVGGDGRIVDNGIAASNGILGPRMVVPVQVLGESDGPLAKEALLQGLYGNPLSGFALR